MATLTQRQFAAKLLTLLPDNTSQEVSVADVREVLGDLNDTLSSVASPSYAAGVLSLPLRNGQVLAVTIPTALTGVQIRNLLAQLAGEERLSSLNIDFVDGSAADVVAILASLTGAARLPASAIQGLPTPSSHSDPVVDIDHVVHQDGAALVDQTADYAGNGANHWSQLAGFQRSSTGYMKFQFGTSQPYLMSVADFDSLAPSVPPNRIMPGQYIEVTRGARKYYIGRSSTNSLHVSSDDATNERVKVWDAEPGVATGAGLTGDGTTASPLAVTQPGQGPSTGLTSVASDATLSGDGTAGSPLAVENPFTDQDETKLDGIEAGAEANVQPDWNAATGDAAIANKPTIPAKGTDTPMQDGVGAPGTSDAYSPDDHVHPATPGQGGTGLASVASDATLSGDGTAGSPLGVAHPFTDQDGAKLDALNVRSIGDFTVEHDGILTLAFVDGEGNAASATLNLPDDVDFIEVVRDIIDGHVQVGDGLTIDADDSRNRFIIRLDTPFSATEKAKLAALPGANSANAGKFLGFDGDGNYAVLDGPTDTAVTSDATLEGVGTTANPLRVARPFTAQDEAKLDRLGVDGIEVSGGSVTPAANQQDVEAQRTPGQTPVGTFADDTGRADRRLLRIHLDGDSGALTVVMAGAAADYAGHAIDWGSRSLLFDSATLSSDLNGTAQFDWFGNHSGWLVAGTTYTWGVTEPLGEATQSTLGLVDFDILDPKYGRVVGIQSLPIPLVVGHKYILLADDVITQDKPFSWLNFATTGRHMQIDGLDTGSGLYAYASNYGPVPDFRGKVFLDPRGGPSGKTPTRVYYHTDLGGTQSYAVASSFVPGQMHRFEVQGLGYDDTATGTRYYVNVEYDDGTKLYADTQVPPGTYYASSPRALLHVSQHIVPADLEADSIAQKLAFRQRIGVTDVRARLAIEELMDTGGDGIRQSLGSSDNVVNDLAQTTTAFDLDDADNRSGVFEVEATYQLTNPSNNTIAFISAANSDEAELNRTIRVTGFVSASRLRASAAYDGRAGNLGLEVVGRATIYQGADVLGRVELNLGHDANNVVGYAMRYVGQTGNATFTINLTNLNVVFAHNDAPAAEGTSRIVRLEKAADSNISIPSTVLADTFGAWQDAMTHTVTAAQAGAAQVTAHVDIDATATALTDNHRIYAETRIIKARGTNYELVALHDEYIRNFGGDTIVSEMGVLEADGATELAEDDELHVQMRFALGEPATANTNIVVKAATAAPTSLTADARGSWMTLLVGG